MSLSWCTCRPGSKHRAPSGQVSMSQLSGGNKWHSWFSLNHRHSLSPSWKLESETQVSRGWLS